MGKDVKTEIEKILKERVENSSVILPKDSLRFVEKDAETLCIEFTDCKYIEENMQDNRACFEGWAVIIKTYCGYDKIILDVKDVKDLYEDWEKEHNDKKQKPRNGHVGRFFYRALRFSEQYEWFTLSEELKAEVQLFKINILDNKTLRNNIPEGEAGKSTAKEKEENHIEDWLAKPGELYKALVNPKGLGFDENDEVYRQLPVGLFEGQGKTRDVVKTENTVFPGRRSAIDMWTCHEDVLYLIELKYNNKMVGMITEIFFYSNYMWDLISDRGSFEPSKPDTEKEAKTAKQRGYDKIQKGKYKQIKGVLLADEGFAHPLVTEQVIKTLNGNKKELAPIEYVRATYEVDKDREVITSKQNN